MHEVPVHEVPVCEEGFSQANVAEQMEQAGQAVMGALAREMAGALRESMTF